MDAYNAINIIRNEVVNKLDELGKVLGVDSNCLLLSLHDAENILRAKIETEKAYNLYKETKEEEPKED